MNFWAIFLTGLFTGGLSCLAVQGGLLATTIAQREEQRLKNVSKKIGNPTPIIAFLVTKLIIYTILGLLLGWIGQIFQLSLTFKVIMQFMVGIFMVGTALNLLNAHPVFRYFIIQPPRFLTKIVRQKSKSGDIFAPGLLGALTVFIPCGTTQAMLALAIASGNPLVGATILFAFTLGTSPIFFILGYFATKLGDSLEKKFLKVAALAIILLAFFNINNAIALTGTNLTLESVSQNIWCTVTFCQESHVLGLQAQNITINIESSGYYPNNISVKRGSLISINLVNKNGQGCSQAFTIPALGVQKIIRPGESDKIELRTPDAPSKIAFMCGMGMFRGIINVI